MNNSEYGSLLISIIIAMVVISALGAGIASMVTTGVRSSTDHSLSIQALYLAESGVEWAGYQLRKEEDEGEDGWIGYCNNTLKDESPVKVDTSKYFEILDSSVEEDSNKSCDITVLGYVGSETPNNALASRRLNVEIDGGWIENVGGSKNIFEDESAWRGQGQNVNFDDGLLTLERPGQGQGNTQTHAKAEDIITEGFSEGDLIYFFANMAWGDSSGAGQGETLFKVRVTPASLDAGAERQLYDIKEDHSSHTMPFSLQLELGNGFTKDDINDVTVVGDFGDDEVDAIYLDSGCIGTINFCTGINQNPISGDTWQEGSE